MSLFGVGVISVASQYHTETQLNRSRTMRQKTSTFSCFECYMKKIESQHIRNGEERHGCSSEPSLLYLTYVRDDGYPLSVLRIRRRRPGSSTIASTQVLLISRP
jgi:hypothetical protein